MVSKVGDLDARRSKEKVWKRDARRSERGDDMPPPARRASAAA